MRKLSVLFTCWYSWNNMCIKNTTLLIMWSVCNRCVDICCCHSYKQKKELTVSICKVISLAGHEEVISGWLHQFGGWLGSVIFKESSVQIKGRYCYFKKYLFPFQPKRSKIISPTLSPLYTKMCFTSRTFWYVPPIVFTKTLENAPGSDSKWRFQKHRHRG